MFQTVSIASKEKKNRQEIGSIVLVPRAVFNLSWMSDHRSCFMFNFRCLISSLEREHKLRSRTLTALMVGVGLTYLIYPIFLAFFLALFGSMFLFINMVGYLKNKPAL
jgi:hypothetical protein